MADIAYNLGDISSLLFNATTAPQSKKKKSSETLANPFALSSKSSPSPFEEAARAQIAVAAQLQAQDTRRQQSSTKKAATSLNKDSKVPEPTGKLSSASTEVDLSQKHARKKSAQSMPSGATSAVATESSPDSSAPTASHSSSARAKTAESSASHATKILQGKMPKNGVVNGIVFKDGKRVTSVDVSPRVPTGERITDPDKDSRTVFVGNVPVSIKLKHIKRHFAPCGEVESVRMRSLPVASPKLSRKGAYATKDFREGASSCNAYVVFVEAASVPAALKLTGSELGGHHVRVDTVGSSASAQKFNNRLSLFVGNLDYRVNEEALHAHFSSVGGDGVVAVRCIRDKSTSFGKGFAYVHFNSVDSLSAALKLDGKAFDGRPLRVSRSDGKASLKRSRPNESSKLHTAPQHGTGATSPQKRTVTPSAPSHAPPAATSAGSSSATRLKKPRHVPRPGATQPTLPARSADAPRPADVFVAKSRSHKVARD